MRLTNKKFWFIILSWLSLTCICVIYLTNTKNPFKIGAINDPRAESALAQQIMEEKLPYGGSRIYVLYKSNNLTTDNQRFKNEVNKSLDGLKKLPYKYQISSPYQNDKQISKDKHVAYAVVSFNNSAEELSNSINQIRAQLGEPKSLEMFIGGQPVYIADIYKLSERNLIRGEVIALPIAFIVMIFVFGGILAALLPIITAIISITIITTILYIIGSYFELTIFVLNIATMLGLGLCLDYSLLLTYRYREEIAKHSDCKKAIHKTLETAGKSIFFSGLAVLISIASLLFFNINLLYSIGVGGIVVVIVSVFCSLTFLPAFLCIIERRINRFSLNFLKPITAEKHGHIWYRFALMVMRRPVLIMIPTVIILLLLGYPFLSVKLNSSNAKILPTWIESRKLMDQFNENFNENELSPINVVFESKNKKILTSKNISELYDYAQQLKKDPRVDRVNSLVSGDKKISKRQYQNLYLTSPLRLSKYEKQSFEQSTKNQYTVMTVISKYPDDNQESLNLVKKIRSTPIGNDIKIKVTGNSAIVIDKIKTVYLQFIKIIIVISIVTYLILIVLLRSLLLPLKAILMNFLSLSVCYGMLVFIFQEGHFSHLLNFEPLGYTELDLPILLFFGLFGLSMDYEVFLLTRIKEYYDKTGDNTKSVACGLERSARIITSAALILVIVAGAFVTADIIFIKAFGLGTALAIAVDASLIRLLLVPTTMRLMGKWNWYLPRWLDKLIPYV